MKWGGGISTAQYLSFQLDNNYVMLRYKRHLPEERNSHLIDVIK